jgi:hypothetical protein
MVLVLARTLKLAQKKLLGFALIDLRSLLETISGMILKAYLLRRSGTI